MNRTENIIRALARAGMTEFKAVRLTDGGTGLMVKHDYYGAIPTRDALEKSEAARSIAEQHGLKSEPRGYKTATLIYLPD